ncbi:MAG: bacterioferritin [Nitrospirales bacterium]|nr:MAG: bacterioferritin [Nitrospirales bacterium]
MGKRKSEDEIRKAIKSGAITKEYKADPKHIITELNKLRSTEISSYLQYKQHAYMAVSLMAPGLKTEFEGHANQELQHADALAERIQQLGGVPIYELDEIAKKSGRAGVRAEQGTTLRDMVAQDLLLERNQIESYTRLIRKTGDNDPVTHQILVNVLQDTEKHAGELADFLTRTADTRK